MNIKINNNISGQVALIVLLIMAAAMTLGLATSKRVVVDTKIDKDEELLKQAFNAAESGIETFLGSGQTLYQSTDNSSRSTIQLSNVGVGTTLLYPGIVQTNSSAIFWLVPHRLDKTIDWGNAYSENTLVVCVTENFNKSLKINYFYKNTAATTYGVDRMVYNFGTGGVTNGVPMTLGGGCPTGYESALTLSTHDDPGLLSVSPLFGSTSILISSVGGVNFPLQGQDITSVGTAGDVTAQAGATRTVKVRQSYGSPNTLIKYILEGLESSSGIFNQ